MAAEIDPTRASALAVAPDLAGTTVAVTGANGFVGARACALLAAAGAGVVAVVRRAGTAPAIGGVEERTVADLGDVDALTAAFDGCDVVVHTVAIAGPDLDAARTVNVEGTRSVAAATVAAGARRLVHVSTTSVLGPLPDGEEVIDEDAPVVDDDATPYAVTKREAEEVVAAVDGVETVVLRPPAVLGWGPTSTWGQRVPDWVRDGELPMELDERGAVAWVHVDDFAAAIAAATVEPRAAGRLYHVASGTTDWATYLGTVHSWFPDSPSPFTPADEAPPARTMDTSRVTEELGWVGTVDLATALGEIAAHHA